MYRIREGKLQVLLQRKPALGLQRLSHLRDHLNGVHVNGFDLGIGRKWRHRALPD